MIPVFNTSTAYIASTLEVMRMQEVSYQCSDYLSGLTNGLKRLQDAISTPVDATCRFKMAEWGYQLVDVLKFRRETVAISMSYLDRYLSTEVGLPALFDRKVFQLAAMTCLYTAIKIHEPEVMHPKVLSMLSEGNKTEEQVTDMELEILNAIQWRMNPPTAHAFLSHFLGMFPEGIMNASDRELVYMHAEFQIQLAVYEYSLVAIDASTVAFAALMNALETSACEGSMGIITMLSNVSRIDIQSSLVAESKDKLSQIAIGASSTGPSVSNLNPKSPVSKPTVLSYRTDLYVSDASSDGQPDAKTDSPSDIKSDGVVLRLGPTRIRWRLFFLVVQRMTRAVKAVPPTAQ